MKPWYNEQRVAQKGSVVLQKWNAARRANRSYAGAAFGRTTNDWVAQSTSADSEIKMSLRTVRNRTRQLVRDNEYANNAINRIIPNNVIGQGIGFQSQAMARRGGKLDEAVNNAIESEWSQWTRADSCHTAGRMAFQEIERALIRGVAESGEILVRMITQPFGKSKVPLALEIIEADQLVDNWTGTANNGNQIRMGVEVDTWQRPVAYWFYPNHPGDSSFVQSVQASNFIRVPAQEIIHIGLFDRPNQTRCMPWLHSVIVKLRHMGGYEEAEIVRARGSAAIMGFIQTPEIDLSVSDSDDDDDKKTIDLSPGQIERLGPGETFTGFNPSSPNAGMDAFMRYFIRSFAAGTGISYESVSKDYSQSNYSSSRLALLDDRDNWRVLQAWLIRTFHQRVLEKWLELAVLSGTLSLPDYEINPARYTNVRWKPRGWEWVDPLKEVTAARMSVRAGFATVDDIVAARGGDVEDTFKNRRRELDLAELYDLTLDTDPAMVDLKGVLQPDEVLEAEQSSIQPTKE